jgi:chromosome segregation ATPase
MNFKTIFSEGKKEWKRRRSISQDTSVLKNKQNVLAERQTSLGARAWNEKIDLSAYSDLKKNLSDHQIQLDDLQKKALDCQKRQTDVENEKNKQIEAFAKENQEIETQKKEADSRLNGEKNILKNLEKDLNQLESRSTQISKERQQLQSKISDAATPADQRSVHEKKLQDLTAEDTDLLPSRTQKSEAILAQKNRMEPLQTEVNELQKKISDALKQQKEKIGELDKQLAEIRKELAGIQAKTKESEKTQNDVFKSLGEALAAAGDSTACLNTELAAVRESEQEISEIKTNIAALDNQKTAEASSAYNKMLAIIIGGILLVIILIVLAVNLFSPKRQNPLQQLINNQLSSNKSETLKAKIKKGQSKDTSSTNVEDLNKEIEDFQKGIKTLTDASKEKIGTNTVVAAESDLKKVLVPVFDWTMSNPIYSKLKFSEIETSSLRTTYRNGSEQSIDVEVTDTHSVAVLLAPSQALFALKMEVDDDLIFQKTGKLGDIPMIESIEKRSGDIRLIMVVKERYLINLKSHEKVGLDYLKKFAGKLNLSSL